MLLLIFACSNSNPVDSSKLAERGGLVYYNKSDTPFSGKGIKYWQTGEVQIKAIFKRYPCSKFIFRYGWLSFGKY